ncbi:MAG: hypothetical protein GYA33_08410 [Thermogutta sp.]|nr:hypothetical protein [Thermogutta sp.]
MAAQRVRERPRMKGMKRSTAGFRRRGNRRVFAEEIMGAFFAEEVIDAVSVKS